MPVIEEIDDEESLRLAEEEKKKKIQDEKEHAKALAEADRRHKVQVENEKQKEARLKRIAEQKKKTQDLLNKLGDVKLDEEDEDLLHTMPDQTGVEKEGLGYEVFMDENKGRGIKATKDFCCGNLILAADPFAYVIFENMAEHVCHYCFTMVIRDKSGKPTTTLMKCSSCKFARYCSRDCQKKHWPAHKKECMAVRVRLG